MPDGEGAGDAPAFVAGDRARPLLTARIPAWLVVIVVMVLAVVAGILAFARQPVDLGGAVDGAVQASVSLTICNETVDRRGLKPRTAELTFEEALRDKGVMEANVVVTRIDCGPDAP